MPKKLKHYEPIVGTAAIRQIEELAEKLAPCRVVHVNSTPRGGGVAEILSWMVPLMNDLGIDTSWEILRGDEAFFNTTKSMHNGLQGDRVTPTPEARAVYMQTNEENAKEQRAKLQEADVVFIHDPQPAALLGMCPDRKGAWVWRCHIDLSHPYRPVWKFLRPLVDAYDASIFSMTEFTQRLSHPQFIIRPSIDPLNEANRDVDDADLLDELAARGIDPDRPLLVQVSRFDRFKDPLGVIRSFELVSRSFPAQLALAGGGAADDPEGEAVYQEVLRAAGDNPDVHVLQLPSDAYRTVNVLQRQADVVLQKSTREGFGLTVTEGLWKGKPVIGGDTGGIRVQVFDYHTGFLVNTPEGAAHRIRFLLRNPEMRREMGTKGKEFVRENFLLTRHLREYLTLMLGLRDGFGKGLYV